MTVFRVGDVVKSSGNPGGTYRIRAVTQEEVEVSYIGLMSEQPMGWYLTSLFSHVNPRTKWWKT